MTASPTYHLVTKYEELFRTYFESLCYFARKYIADQDTCRELVHGVFVNIWEKKEDFDFEKPAKSYLFTSVYNRCMNYIRDQKKFVSDPDNRIAGQEIGESVSSDHMESAETENRIWNVINSLPEKCREIFVLNRFEEKKYAEIAEQLQISVKTVETQMSKALKILRENLSDLIYILILLLLRKL